MENSDKCGMTWVPRKGNVLTHSIAKLAAANNLGSRWCLEPPETVKMILNREAIRVSPTLKEQSTRVYASNLETEVNRRGDTESGNQDAATQKASQLGIDEVQEQYLLCMEKTTMQCWFLVGTCSLPQISRYACKDVGRGGAAKPTEVPDRSRRDDDRSCASGGLHDVPKQARTFLFFIFQTDEQGFDIERYDIGDIDDDDGFDDNDMRAL
ncbi:hypothetical protein AHAS_Ahas01G0143000 [Arachis hypogaea]